MARPQTDVEHAGRSLNEALARLREQVEFANRLAAGGQPTEAARDLLKSMKATIEQMQTHLQFLVETEGKQE